MIQHEIRILEFIGGGSPLTAQERQQAAQAVDTAMGTAPDRWRAVDAAVQNILTNVDQHNMPLNNMLREQNRYNYAFASTSTNGWVPEYAIEKRIIEAHDPVVAIDQEHKRLVTQHSMHFLLETGTWVARNFKLSPPRSDFEAVVRSYLEREFLTLEPAIAEGIAHIERDAWYTSAYFDHLPEPKRTNFFTNTRDKTFHLKGDSANEQWQLAEAAGMLAAFAARQAPAQSGPGMMSQQILMRQMTQKALTGAMRGMSPECNVTVGSYSRRAQNGCYP
jgi:hypothetical protein